MCCRGRCTRRGRQAIAAHRYPKAVYGRTYWRDPDYVFEVDQEIDKPRMEAKLFEIAARYGAGIPRKNILLLTPSDCTEPDPVLHAREQRARSQEIRRERLKRYLETSQPS